MRRILFLLALVAAMAAAAAAYAAEGHDTHAGHAAAAAPASVILEGEIVDITCYLRHQASGPKHLKCAVYCADQGMPFGFVDAGTGKIYLLLPDGHANPTTDVREHFGQQVKVSGIITEGNGITGLQIGAVSAI